MPPNDASIEIPDKVFFRIGEVSRLTGVKPYTLRFWEGEFGRLKPKKSKSGQRLYRRSDVEMVLRIKDLLWGRKFTIAGARAALARPDDEETLREVPPPIQPDDALQVNLETRSRELDGRASALELRSEELDAAAGSLVKTRDELGERVARLAERDAKQAQREARLSAREAQLADREAELRRRDRELLEREAKVAGGAAALADLDQRAAQVADLDARASRLDEREAELAREAEALSVRSAAARQASRVHEVKAGELVGQASMMEARARLFEQRAGEAEQHLARVRDREVRLHRTLIQVRRAVLDMQDGLRHQDD